MFFFFFFFFFTPYLHWIILQLMCKRVLYANYTFNVVKDREEAKKIMKKRSNYCKQN